MKIAVRYQSRGGNTKAAAEAIAKAAGTKAEPLDIPVAGPVDLLFAGGGIYAFGMDDALKDYLQSLEPGMVKRLAAFSTGSVAGIAGKIAAAAADKGIPACEQTLSLKMGMRNFSGKGDSKLSEKQLRQIEDFVKALVKGRG